MTEQPTGAIDERSASSAEADTAVDADPDTDADDPASQTRRQTKRNTPGRGVSPLAREIEPNAPDEFGLVQVWWGDGKGKTTAALGMGMRAVGHGYRVHLLQLMKGGADSVEAVRGEYNAIGALPGFSFENTGHYGWHGMADGSDATEHERNAQAGLERAHTLVDAAADADLTTPLAPDGAPEAGVHMLIIDEILYAADRDLLSTDAVCDLIDRKPEALELVLTGSHEPPTYLYDRAHLVTEVGKISHPIESGQRARKGTEY